MKAYSPPSGHATVAIIWVYSLDLHSVVWVNGITSTYIR